MATSRLAQIAAFTPPIAPTDTFVGVQGGAVDVQYAASAVVGSDTLGMSNLGNTLGTSGVVSGLNVELLLAGGNNITLSQSINGSSATITIIGGAGGGGGDTAMSAFAVGNTTLSTTGTVNLSSASFEGAGLVSLGISNGSIVISGTSAAQTNQTLGLIAVSNTTISTSATVDARSLSFEGAGLVSVGASNGSVVISATSAAQTNQQLSMFGVGNTTLSTSGTGNASAHSFEGAGLVSVGISAGSVVISATSAAQTNQQLSLFAVSNTTLSTSGTGNASAHSFEGAGLVSVGVSAGSVIISATSAAQTNQTDGIYATGNTTGNSSSFTHDARSLTIEFDGIISGGWSTNNSHLIISATSAAQTNQQLSLFAVSNTTLSTSGTGNASAHSFEGAGLVSVGISGGSVIISGSSSQSNQQISGFAVSNTTLSTSGTLNASNLSFEGAGGVSVGISNGSVVISGGAGGGGTVLTAFATSNTTLSTSGTIALSNLIIEGAGAASVGVSNGSIIISAGAGGQTNQTGGVYASSNTTLSTSGTYDARSLSIAGAGAISVEASNSGWQISGPVQSFLIGVAPISLSSNSNSISIEFNGPQVSQFEPLQFGANSSASSLGQSTIYFQHFNVPENLQVCRLDRLVSLSINAAVSGSTAASGNRSNSWVYQETIGLYSRGTGASSTNLNSFMQNVWSLGMSESVSIFSTGNATNCGVAQSYNLGFIGHIDSAGGTTSGTFSSATSSSSAATSVSQANILTNVSGLAVLNVPFGSTLLSGGDYWLAMVGSSARTTAGTSTNLMSLSNIVLTAFNTDLKFLGQTATGTSNTLIPGDGAYSATATSFLSSLGIPAVSNNSNASLYFNLMNVTL